MWCDDDFARPKVDESGSVAEDPTAVCVRPPLSMTLLDAMNRRGPPSVTGFSDNEPLMY